MTVPREGMRAGHRMGPCGRGPVDNIDRPGGMWNTAAECLDHLLICGERHLWRTLTEYAQHYKERRPHQSREQRPPLHEPGQPVDVTARIKRRQVAHGLINEYRTAA